MSVMFTIISESQTHLCPNEASEPVSQPAPAGAAGGLEAVAGRGAVVRGEALPICQTLGSVSAIIKTKDCILLLNHVEPETTNSTRKLTNEWNILFSFYYIFIL